jgi:hypothetical protein
MSRARVRKIRYLAAAALLLSACGGEGPVPQGASIEAVSMAQTDRFRAAFPAAESLEVTPEMDVEPTRALLQQLTWNVSKELNHAVHALVGTVTDIVEDETPSYCVSTVCVWGPHRPPQQLLTWTLVIRDKGNRSFEYVVKAQAPEGEFKPILWGTTSEDGNVGSLFANGTTLHELDPIGYPKMGRAVVAYDDPPGIEHKVHMVMNGFSDGELELEDYVYGYEVAADNSGAFNFAARHDLDDDGSAQELLMAQTRWDTTQAGAGAAAVKEGDLPSGVVVHLEECWDSLLMQVYYQDNFDILPPYGSQDQCVLPLP